MPRAPRILECSVADLWSSRRIGLRSADTVGGTLTLILWCNANDNRPSQIL